MYRSIKNGFCWKEEKEGRGSVQKGLNDQLGWVLIERFKNRISKHIHLK